MASATARRTLSSVRIASAALCFVALSARAVENGATTVYKCTQANGAVLYTDYACKGSVVVDIKRDAVDPAAGERLENAQAEFDKAAVRRKADAEMAALHRDESNQHRRALEAAASGADSASATPDLPYGTAYGFAAPLVKHRTSPSRAHGSANQHRTRPKRQVPAAIPRPARPG